MSTQGFIFYPRSTRKWDTALTQSNHLSQKTEQRKERLARTPDFTDIHCIQLLRLGSRCYFIRDLLSKISCQSKITFIRTSGSYGIFLCTIWMFSNEGCTGNHLKSLLNSPIIKFHQRFFISAITIYHHDNCRSIISTYTCQTIHGQRSHTPSIYRYDNNG